MTLKFIILAALLILSSAAIAEPAPRSAAVKAEFQRQNPCPANGQRRGACPGYVKDHIIALACGGPDTAENLQWQTIEEGKAKDKWERKKCRK